MGLTFLEPLMANAPWAAVLIVCAIPVAIVVMFVVALFRAPRENCVEAIKAMAELAKALRPGKQRQLPP